MNGTAGWWWKPRPAFAIVGEPVELQLRDAETLGRVRPARYGAAVDQRRLLLSIGGEDPIVVTAATDEIRDRCRWELDRGGHERACRSRCPSEEGELTTRNNSGHRLDQRHS